MQWITERTRFFRKRRKVTSGSDSDSEKKKKKKSSGVNFQYSSNDRSFLYNCPVSGIQHSGVFVAHLLCGEGGVSVLGEVIGAVGMPEISSGQSFQFIARQSAQRFRRKFMGSRRPD